MKITILSQWDKTKVLFKGEYESLKEGLEAAIKSRADLSGADLSGADLSRANLSRADLSRAKNCNKYLTTPLYGMLDQIGKIRAYKLVNEKNKGPFRGGLQYNIGKTVRVDKASTDEREQCAVGISLATLDWCIKEWRNGYKILLVEFEKKDIAAIPIASDGKFRVRKCRIVRKINLEKVGIRTVSTERKSC